MGRITGTHKSPGEKFVKDIKRATREHYSSKENLRIVMNGLRGEDHIAKMCRCERYFPRQVLRKVDRRDGNREATIYWRHSTRDHGQEHHTVLGQRQRTQHFCQSCAASNKQRGQTFTQSSLYSCPILGLWMVLGHINNLLL